MHKSLSAAVGLLGAVTALVPLSCAREERGNTAAAPSRPNVLLITFDTTRADHVGAYGNRNAFTPTLDALARRSVKFNRAFATAPITLPSHCTIMTGLYPFYHGVRDNSHFVLSPEVNTLAEVLHDAGYQTAAIVAAFVLDERFGLDQGFDLYSDDVEDKSQIAVFAMPERKAALVTDEALQWLGTLDENRPFFAWVHYYDPHFMYAAPASFTKYQGHPYDEEIAYADSELGRLLNFVEQLSAGGNETMIVFTSDHGEALGQYGEPTHAYFAYDSTLHVPLLLRMPGGSYAGREIDVPVTLADLMPTILEGVGLAVPGPEQIHGKSLLPLLQSPETAREFAERPTAFESLEPHFNYRWAAVEGVRVGEKKYIQAPQPELYLLAENPKENRQANRYDDMPELAAALAATYRTLYETELAFPPFTATPQTPDADTIDRLRALGYVASEVSSEPQAGAGKDLKEMLRFYRGTLQAMSMISAGDAPAAVELLLTLLQEEPDNERVLWLLSETMATTPATAADALPAIAASLNSKQVPAGMIPQVLHACGRACVATGDLDGALRHFAEAAEAKQDYAAAHEALGLVQLRLNHGAQAVTSLRRAVELYEPYAARSRVELGLALFAEGQVREGVREWQTVWDKFATSDATWAVATACPLDAAIAERFAPLLQRVAADTSLSSPMQGALGIAASRYYSLGGQNREALAALKQAGAHVPDDDVALHVELAGLHLRLQENADARRVLEDAYRRAPDEIAVVEGLANVLDRTGEIDRAVELLDTFYQAHADNGRAANNLAWMLARQAEDLDRALKLAKSAVTRLPGDPTRNDTLGWIYHLRGDQEMAAMRLTRATKAAPASATYQYHLGKAHQAGGKTDQAREAFAQAIELAIEPYPEWYEEARRALQSP